MKEGSVASDQQDRESSFARMRDELRVLTGCELAT